MGDPTRQLPILAPGPRGASGGAGAASALPTSRPKKNSTACLACKQAKRKVGSVPLWLLLNFWLVVSSQVVGIKSTVVCALGYVRFAHFCFSLQCSGRPSPCKACEAADSECIFDETLDLRRKVAMKRTVDELVGYKELLYSLLETLARQSRQRSIISYLLFAATLH
ncbi:hypothetical protein VTN96DRAFT_5495 [Rasamsonia emersonii]